MKFRIIRDNFAGYEVQVLKISIWGFKGWFSISSTRPGKLGVNTRSTLEAAHAVAKTWANPLAKEAKVIEEFDL